MKILKTKIIEKLCGYEEIVGNFPDRGYCGKLLHLKKGYRCSIHRLDKDETFYILEVRVYFELENNECELKGRILVLGDIVNIFDEKWHRFSSLENSLIIEFSTPDVENERKVVGGFIPDFENWREGWKVNIL